MGGVYLVRINHIWKIPGFLDSFIQFKSQLLQISPKDIVTEILFNFHEKMRKRRGGGFLTLQIHVTGHTARSNMRLHSLFFPLLFQLSNFRRLVHRGVGGHLVSRGMRCQRYLGSEKV